MKHCYILLTALLLTTATAAQPVFSWTPTEIGAGHNLQKMTVSNNQAVVAGYGRTFVKSEDNGDTWNDIGILVPKFDFLDLSAKGNTGYLVSRRAKLYDARPTVHTNGFMIRTNDGGTTWEPIGLPGLAGDDPALDPSAPRCFGHDFSAVCAVNDSVVYCSLQWYEYDTTQANLVKAHAGIFKSADKGATWKNLNGDMSNPAASIAAFDTTVFAGGNKFLYKTTIRLDTLQNIMPNLNTAGAGYVNGIKAVTNDEVYVITTANGIFKSPDGGNVFTPYTISGVTGGNDMARVGDQTLLVVGGSGKSRVSTDDGATWKDAGLTVAAWEVGPVLGDSLQVLTKSDIYKIKVTDLTAGTMSWVKQTVSYDNNILKMVVFNSGNAFVAGLGETFRTSDDQGKTWSDVTLPEVPRYDNDLDFPGLRNIGDTAYACLNRFYLIDFPSTSTETDLYFPGTLFKTTNNWATFSTLDASLIGKNEGADASLNPQLARCNGLNTSVIEYLGNKTVLLYARWYDISGATKVEHSRVFKTIDEGKNWKGVTDDVKDLYVQDIRFRGDTGYVAGKNILLKSDDRGETFTDLYPAFKTTAGTDQFIYTVTFGPGKEIFITTTTAVFRSPDGGLTFTKLTGTSGGNDFWRFDSDSWLVMGTISKSIFTNNSGTSWTDARAGATIFEIGGVWNGNVYALGQGKLYRTPLEGLAINTAVKEIPLKNELVVAYGRAAVELFSPEKTIDRCRVYSVTGRLVSDTQPAAHRTVLNFNRFVPGVYIARTMVGGKLFVNKIVIP